MGDGNAAIIAMLQQIQNNQTATTNTLGTIVTRLDTIDTRLDTMQTQVDGTANDLKALQATVDTMKTNADAMKAQLDGLQESVDDIQDTVRDIQDTADALRKDQLAIAHGTFATEGRKAAMRYSSRYVAWIGCRRRKSFQPRPLY
jgi:chromosome segregation ATPase